MILDNISLGVKLNFTRVIQLRLPLTRILLPIQECNVVFFPNSSKVRVRVQGSGAYLNQAGLEGLLGKTRPSGGGGREGRCGARQQWHRQPDSGGEAIGSWVGQGRSATEIACRPPSSYGWR